MEDTVKLPRDAFSTRLRELSNHPEAVPRESVVNITDDYGNLTTWIVTSFRHDGRVTLFLQRNTSEGGDRWVLPPQVTDAIHRQRAGAVKINRRKSAAKGYETRKAAGTQHIPTAPKRQAKRARRPQAARS